MVGRRFTVRAFRRYWLVSDQVMVIVSDLDNANHGEINVVGSISKAARLVETLLETGLDEARIRVFAGSEVEMRVRHKPIVSLVANNEGSKFELDDGVDKPAETFDADAESSEQEGTAAPYQQNGVRFANAFRSA
jgi:hypothetical protein